MISSSNSSTSTIAEDLAGIERSMERVESGAKRVQKITGTTQARLGYSDAPQAPTFSSGGGANIPTQPTSAAANNGGWSTAWAAMKAGAAFLPSAAAGVERQQRTYWAGAAVGNYQTGENVRQAMRTGMAGNMTSINSDVRMGQMLANRAWVNPQQWSGAASLTSAASRTLGYGNEEFLQSHMQTIGNVDWQNAALIGGVQTKNAQGGNLVGEQLYASIYKKLNIGSMSKQEIANALQPGRGISTNPLFAGMSDMDKQMFQSYALNGGKMGIAEGENSRLNPRKAETELVTAETERVETSMDASVRGYVMVTEGLTKVSGALDDLYNAIKPLADLIQSIAGGKLALDNGGGLGAAVSGGLGLAGGWAASKILGKIGGKVGGKILGKLGGKAGASLVAKFGAKAAAKGMLGIGAKGLAKAIPGVGAALSIGSGAMAASKDEGFFGSGFWSSVGGGALAGGIFGGLAGGGIGAIPGALVGGLMGGAEYALGYGGAKALGAGGDSQQGAAESGLSHRSSGAWKLPKGEIARLHENEMVIPASVAESFRTAVQTSMATGSNGKSGGGGLVKVEVTLKNASWGEAQKLIQIVKDAVDTTREMDLLGTT